MKQLLLLLSFALCSLTMSGVTNEELLQMVDSAYSEAMSGNIPHAIQINEDGLSQTPRDSVDMCCEFYSCLLYCYHRLGDYEKAAYYGELCLAYDEAQGDKSNLSASLGNLAGIYSSAGKHDVATEYLRRAIEIEEELLKTDKEHTKKSLAIRKAMLGEVLLAKVQSVQSKEQEPQSKQQGQMLAEALTLTKEALAIDRELGREMQVGMRLSQLGNIYLQLGDAAEARHCNKEALRIARETGNRMTEVITLLQLGENREAAALAHELGMKRQEEEACRALAAEAKLHGDYKEATLRLERAEELRDMIQTEESERQLTMWQVRYDTQRKEAEIESQARRLRTKHMQQQWLIAVICVSVVAMILAVVLAWLSARRKREIEKEALQKDRHYTILSHDLKNPMVAQQQVLRMLYRDFDSHSSEEMKKNISRLLAGSDTQLELVQNLQEVALLELGKRQAQPVRLDVASVIREVSGTMQSVADLKHITFDIQAKRTLVVGDRENLRNILRNLLSNAVKFSYEGSSVEIGTTAPDKFYVQDCGIGMSAERIEELLHSDTPLSSSKGTTGEGGTGIGILLCRELLKMNNGRLEIKSEPGKGSTFIITLPV